MDGYGRHTVCNIYLDTPEYELIRTSIVQMVIMVAVVGIVTVIVLLAPDMSGQFPHKELKVTIPENLDYNGIFDDIFMNHTRKAEMMRVETVNMGSLYELCYTVELKSRELEKNMLDEIRCSHFLTF